MTQPSTFSDTSTPAAQPHAPLLSRLARWWSPQPASEPALGYESAQPWALPGGPVDTQPSPD